MIRAAYRGLLWLHPAQFGERFSEDMLWIFDLRRSSELGIVLLLDCLASVCRQWWNCQPVRTFAIGLLFNCMLALCSAICVWNTPPRP